MLGSVVSDTDGQKYQSDHILSIRCTQCYTTLVDDGNKDGITSIFARFCSVIASWSSAVFFVFFIACCKAENLRVKEEQ